MNVFKAGILAFPALLALGEPEPAYAAQTGDTLAVGMPAPDFSLPDQSGGTLGLKDFAGHWLVLYFYPKDFTGGCTLEAHNFQRDSAKYAAAGAVIAGVSLDSQESHRKFCVKEGLGFRLLADSGGLVAARYASLHRPLGFKLAARNTYLIDPEGKIARVFRGVKPAKHSEEVLAALAELGKRSE